jgi:hypothetical protein
MATRGLTLGRAATLGVCVALSSDLRAVAMQLAYEPFNIDPPTAGQYTVGPLAGQNPTGSFFSGAWQTRSATAPNAAIQATGLSYLGSPSSGGSQMSSPNSQPFRSLATPWDATTAGTYYIGFEVNFGAGIYNDADGFSSNDIGYRAVEFLRADNTFGFGISYNGTNGNQYVPGNTDPRTGRMVLDAGVNYSQFSVISNSPLSFVKDSGTTHLVVLKFSLSAATAADSVSVFLDPTNPVEPSIPGATLAGVDFTLGAIGGATIYGGTGTFPVMDELRVGTTFADVLPTLPYPGDTDGDGDVDLVDYQHIFDNFNTTGQNTLHGDIALSNGLQGADGNVDLGDFHLWKTNFPHSAAGASASTSVPEPGSILLAFFGVILFGGRDSGLSQAA